MRIMITGGTGLLGNALIETNGRHNHSICAVYYGDYRVADSGHARYFNTDICDENKMAGLFQRARPEVVIHTAGIANVDRCEKEYDQARRSNVYGTKIVADACRRHNSRLVFISTNAVFDGKNAPYSEGAMPAPVNIYGKLKLEAEGLVKNSGLKHLIIRPILMYGWNHANERANTVTWLVEKLKNGERVNIVNDVYENPIFNISCAEIIWSLVDSKSEGTYHVAGKDTVSRYEFAKIIADIFGLEQVLINQVSSDFFPGLAPRPHNTSYDTSKVEKAIGMKMRGLREDLAFMKNLKENCHANG